MPGCDFTPGGLIVVNTCGEKGTFPGKNGLNIDGGGVTFGGVFGGADGNGAGRDLGICTGTSSGGAKTPGGAAGFGGATGRLTVPRCSRPVCTGSSLPARWTPRRFPASVLTIGFEIRPRLGSEACSRLASQSSISRCSLVAARLLVRSRRLRISNPTSAHGQ